MKYRGKVFGLQYTVYSSIQYKVLRSIGGGDRADIFNLIQNSQNTSVHLKVDQGQWRIARGSKRQAGGSGPLARYLSLTQGYGTTHITQLMMHLIRKTNYNNF